MTERLVTCLAFARACLVSRAAHTARLCGVDSVVWRSPGVVRFENVLLTDWRSAMNDDCPVYSPPAPPE